MDTRDSRQKIDKKYGVIVIVVVILAVAALCFGIFRKLTKKEVPDFVRTQTVNVTHLNYGSIEKEISVTGLVQPVDNSTITAKCSGELLELFVKNGDKVNKGDPICVLNNKKAIDAAKISYEQAKNTYERYSRLYSTGNLSKQSFEDYKTSYERAKLEYETQVEYGTPLANIDGTIDGLELNLNTTVTNGRIICYINSEGLNEVKFGVSERVLKGINVGDSVKITKQGITYDAEVVSVSKQVNTSTGQFDVRAMIKSENSLASGVMTKCTFIYDRKDNVKYLSRNIVYYEGEEPFVYAVKDDNTIEKKFIKTGIENDENVEIVSGVTDATKIISTWSNDLAEGALVKINKDEPGKKASVVKTTDTKNVDEKETVKEEKVVTSNEIEISEETDQRLETEGENNVEFNENNKKTTTYDHTATSSETKHDSNIENKNDNEKDKNVTNNDMATKSNIGATKDKLEE